jgi:hypothetical protein
MSIVPSPQHKDINSFYDKTIQFETLQVKMQSGLFAKRKKASIRKYPERYNGIQINSIHYVNALVFDCDHDDVLEFSDYNLPVPTITVVNKHNGKHHHIYYLKNPIPLFCATQKTKEYLRDLYNGLTDTLQADTNYTGIITKNFINSKEFKIFGSLQKYELNDFKDYTKSQNKTEHKKKEIIKEKTETSFSRHITLFDKIRYFGYGIAKECTDYDELEQKLTAYANSVNKTFVNPINAKYIIKSVLDYCWTNRYKFSDSKWNWDYVKKTKEEVSQSHKNRWKREREIKYKETIKKAREKLSRFKALKILLNSNNHQIHIIKHKKKQLSNTKNTIRYITCRESLDDKSCSFLLTSDGVSSGTYHCILRE